MFFNGGLIPLYMVVKDLHLLNTPYVLMIVGSVWVFNIIIAKTFFEYTIPNELLEAAFMDGCGNLRFFLSIVLPVSKSIVAVIALFYAVGQWNSYFNALIYVTEKELFPLQLILRGILIQGQALTDVTDASELDALAQMQHIAEVIKYGVVIVSTLPLICIYPFLQKYFVKGVMIGSVKG
jgi:putative aldouronate transport system permease protein